ncbi:MAG: S-layer homology domain-containing protein [Bacillota bacterium]|nr:S-layer homology domain-containing protein [Bacillota bacterium]
MERKICTILGVILGCLVLAATAALAEAPKDVPPNHPAYRAIQTLIEQGYLGVFQDGAFRGDRPVDRYTLATVVARLMSDVQSGKLVLPSEEMKTLRQLATEFRAELVEVAGQVTAVAQAQEKTAGEVAVVREDTTRLLGELYQQQQAVAALQRDVQALQAETARQADREALAALTKTVNEVLVPQAQALSARQSTLEASMKDLQAEFESYRRASEREMAALKVQNRNQLIGGLMLAALLFLSR